MAGPAVRAKVVDDYEILTPGGQHFSYNSISDIRPLAAGEQLHGTDQALVDELYARLIAQYMKDRQGNLVGSAPDFSLTITSLGRSKDFRRLPASADSKPDNLPIKQASSG